MEQGQLATARRLAPRVLRVVPTRDARTRDLSLLSAFLRAKKLELQYATRLRSVARAIDHYIRGMMPHDVSTHPDAAAIERVLHAYANTLEPWARAVGNRMITEVAARDDRSWARVAATMGRALRREIETAPTGQVMRERLDDQVELITSLPREAAQRVRHLATEAKVQGTRASALSAKILETGEVTKARANLIARTETTRTATELTAARAQHVGSTHFRWVTAGDSDVRKSHKVLNNRVFEWANPPVCDAPDLRALPGCIFNCRCYAEPILPGDEDDE